MRLHEHAIAEVLELPLMTRPCATLGQAHGCRFGPAKTAMLPCGTCFACGLRMARWIGTRARRGAGALALVACIGLTAIAACSGDEERTRSTGAPGGASGSSGTNGASGSAGTGASGGTSGNAGTFGSGGMAGTGSSLYDAGGDSGVRGAPRDSGQCNTVASCVNGDAATCPSGFSCNEMQQCCLTYFGCLMCSCDAECPRNRPFCRGGLCSECATHDDCPSERPCCAPVIDSSEFSCSPRSGGRCPGD